MLTLVEELVNVVAPTVTLASTLTGPATVPLVRTVEASPARVPALLGAMVSPPPGPLINVNVTCVPSIAGLPLTSLTLKVMVDFCGSAEPRTPMRMGSAETNSRLPAAPA